MTAFVKRIGLTGVLSAALIGTAEPEAYDTSCVDRVLHDCTLALANANWLEKIIIGDVCTAKLLYCSTKTA